jgi:hypothetical protein
MPGFEPARFGRRKSLVGNLEISDGLQCLSHAAELLLEAGAQRPDGGSGARGTDRVEGMSQELAALLVMLGRAIGADQGQGLLPLETMALDGLANRLLIRGRQGAQGMGQGEPHRASLNALLHRLTQPLGQGQTGGYPLALVPAHLGDGGRAQPLIEAQRLHHPGLVHGRERPRRTVGLQQGHLLRHAGEPPFQHHRHLLEPRQNPLLEALEAIDHIEESIVGLHHAQRQLGEIHHALGSRSRRAAQPPMARAHLVDRHQANPRLAGPLFIFKHTNGLRCRHDRLLTYIP